MCNMTKPQSTGLKECKMEYAFVPTKSPDVLLEFVVADFPTLHLMNLNSGKPEF